MSFPKFLKIGVRPATYLIEVCKNRTNHWKVKGGIEGFLIKDLSQMMGFDYEIYMPEDGEYGRINSDGNWIGLLGMLQRGEVDMVPSLLLTEDRFKDFAYIPYSFYEFSFVTNKPHFRSAESRFDHPFETEVWIACFCAYVLTTIMLWILSPRSYSLSNTAIETLRIILRQNATIEKTRPSTSANIVLRSWIVVSMLLSCSYSAVLLSFMTLPPVTDSIRTIDQLANAVENHNYKVFTYEGPTFTEILGRTSRLQGVADKIVKNKWYFPFESGLLPQQFDSNSALFGILLVLQMTYGIEPFTTKYVSEDVISMQSTGSFVRKTFEHKKELRWYLSRLVESGIDKKHLHEIITQRNFSRSFEEETVITTVTPLTLKELKPIFYFLLIGLLLASIVLIFETVYSLSTFNKLVSIQRKEKEEDTRVKKNRQRPLQKAIAWQRISSIDIPSH